MTWSYIQRKFNLIRQYPQDSIMKYILIQRNKLKARYGACSLAYTKFINGINEWPVV